ncbi:hypothetical protein B0H66DRAFT_541292 [Apodospora peruviana]|uniref:Uncharacterized protein n=1 Tax=Apodospora peruviana TaxID=516989 RepID=A0AAE0MEE8_9PEZI|nr:hypothetical protein B0H66DRAFT_541292 [Apodospora peruviana]
MHACCAAAAWQPASSAVGLRLQLSSSAPHRQNQAVGRGVHTRHIPNQIIRPGSCRRIFNWTTTQLMASSRRGSRSAERLNRWGLKATESRIGWELLALVLKLTTAMAVGLGFVDQLQLSLIRFAIMPQLCLINFPISRPLFRTPTNLSHARGSVTRSLENQGRPALR